MRTRNNETATPVSLASDTWIRQDSLLTIVAGSSANRGMLCSRLLSRLWRGGNSRAHNSLIVLWGALPIALMPLTMSVNSGEGRASGQEKAEETYWMTPTTC